MATLENVNGLNPQQVRPTPPNRPSLRPAAAPASDPQVKAYPQCGCGSTSRFFAPTPPPPVVISVAPPIADRDHPNPTHTRQVPALVMRSVENARGALDDGDFDKAIKMMNSTDALCAKVVAPPTIHGLAMRVLSDAYVAKGQLGNAKAALEKGLALCKPHDGRAGMPPFMKADLNGRMGDLLMALGEIHRSEGDAKGACRRMRQAIERFEVLGHNEFVAATHNRIALTLIEEGKHKLAMDEIVEAEKMGAGTFILIFTRAIRLTSCFVHR